MGEKWDEEGAGKIGETAPKRRPSLPLGPAPNEALSLLEPYSQLPSFRHSCRTKKQENIYEMTVFFRLTQIRPKAVEQKRNTRPYFYPQSRD